MITIHTIAYGSVEYEQELALRNEVLRKPLGLDIKNDDLSRESIAVHLGAFQDGKIIGCVVLVPEDHGTCKLTQMAVRPECQGQGIGAQLVREFERTTRARGITQIHMDARASAQRFYIKLGYTAAGGEYLKVGIPHVRMEKDLAKSRDGGAGSAV
jgi:predicted GNAT family N-acyltransferase